MYQSMCLCKSKVRSVSTKSEAETGQTDSFPPTFVWDFPVTFWFQVLGLLTFAHNINILTTIIHLHDFTGLICKADSFHTGHLLSVSTENMCTPEKRSHLPISKRRKNKSGCQDSFYFIYQLITLRDTLKKCFLLNCNAMNGISRTSLLSSGET